MKVIVGTRELWPTPNLASRILTIMLSQEETVWGMRAKRHAEYATSTELLAAKIAHGLKLRVVPWVSSPTVGSAAGFKRDVDMVAASEGVYAFFGAEGPVEGGTAHVVECALRRSVPVVAYGLDTDGQIIEIGHDGGHFYKDVIAPVDDAIREEVGWRK